MSDAPRRERRSPMVMLLDALMRLAIAVQAGPQPRVRPAGRGRRATVGWLTFGVLLAVAGTTVVVGALLDGPDDLSSLPPRAPAPAPVADPDPSARRSELSTTAPAPPGATTTQPPPSASAPVAAISRSAVPPAEVPLTARYETVDGGTGLLGYAAEVTITNPGAAVREGWQLTLTLPRPTLQIAQVSGATARQDGATWTIEPDPATRSVPADGSVLISFEVRGATLLAAAAQDCRIDGVRCAGIDGSPPPPA